MPSYAYLEYDIIPCPNCCAPLWCGYEPEPCYITFQWGYCPARFPGERIYRVGDDLCWRPCHDGLIRAWTGFDGGNRFNVGDPAIASVIVTDVGTDVAHFPQKCQRCGSVIGGAALHIKQNAIVSAWAFLPGQIRSGLAAVYYTVADDGRLVQIPVAEAEPWQVVNYYVEQADGSWAPMPEWEHRGCDHFEG